MANETTGGGDARGDLRSLEIEQHDGIVTVTMAGPGKGNAMGPDFWRELPRVFSAFDRDEAVRVIVLRGKGENFSYGLDLVAMAPTLAPLLGGDHPAKSRTQLLDLIGDLQEATNAVARCRKPVIAAIDGHCIGGGVDLITACDVRLATSRASFSVREVRVAMVADLGTLQRLPGIVGEGHARELALTGRDIDAARALRIGLVNDVYESAEALYAAAGTMATAIAENPPLVVEGVKRVRNHHTERQAQAGLDHVALWNAAFLPSDDLTEAFAAFATRRKPVYRGSLAMFETAELGHTVDEETYATEMEIVRKKLLEAQEALREEAAFPVLVVMAGIEGAGKGDTGNALLSWLDPRYVRTLAFGNREGHELERPPLHRYWVDLPPKGRIAAIYGSWYEEPLDARATKRIGKDAFERELARIVRFENVLTSDGVRLVKLWFHLSKKGQKERLDALEAKKETRWRVTKEDRARQQNYPAIRAAAGVMLRQTSTAEAPWIVVDGGDARYRELTVAHAILAALEERVAEVRGAKKPKAISGGAPPLAPALDGKNVLSALDLTKTLPKKEYEEQLAEAQRRLALLLRKDRFQKRSLVCVFEGMDAAGKGGAIKRVTAAIDARMLRIVPIAAPSEEERLHPYLWRFYRHVPRHGRVAIFDRSWYGRVLVERVESFCSEADYQRAYHEIADFERDLTHAGAIVTKFWLHVSDEEQLARFRERKASDLKRFKITEEDWRNRKKSGAYEIAAAEMVERTSLEHAPWTLVEANDKRWARLRVIETIVDRLKTEL